MVKRPKRLDFTAEEVEFLIDRIETQSLEVDDFPLLADLVRAMVWMEGSLREKSLSIARLKAVFGIKTESARKLKGLLNPNGCRGSKGHGDQDASESPSSDEPSKDDLTKGHGHRPANDYQEAKLINVAHEVLKKGSICPACGKGKLFNLAAGTVLRIVGQPWLDVHIYKPERLRCPACQKVFTARLPEELYTESRIDKTAKAIVSILKYRGGVPFYRQEQIQTILGNPISDTEIWGMTRDVANCIEPVFIALCQAAANSECVHNDDTMARVLSLMKENEIAKPERKGIFTTGILGKRGDKEIALFFTGRQHAGENLNDLLSMRDATLSSPIQVCDGSSRNIPADHCTQVGKCNAHARRNFYEIASYWPKECINVVSSLDLVFLNDKIAQAENLSAEERLKWHQERSAPIMTQIKNYCEGLIESKQIEPNSSFGKAVQYLKNHWEGLTLFLRVPGVPLSNNDNERQLKRAVLNRKNAYFFRNEAGARIADILLSVIETCILNDINPYNYLTKIQEHAESVLKAPEAWLPWKYVSNLEPHRCEISPAISTSSSCT